MDLESNEVFQPSDPSMMAPPPPINWHAWMRRLLVCNPFFLCSAALLLFGVTRLSLDPKFLPEEQANLLFNYSSLQFYELLVIGAAIILARRKIWYDSSLLVVVEHGLVLIPFMLISQGALLSPRLGIALALGAMLMAALRGLAIRRAYPLFNLPPRVLSFGAVLLLFNAALPAIFPSVIEKDQDDWITPNLILWYLVLPLLVGGANLLPRPTRYGGLNPQRHWLPLFIYILWVAGSGTHFWCLGYISGQPFQIYYLAPAAFVAAWTLWRRIPDCVQQPGAPWEMAMLCLTFASPLVALGEPTLFAVLALMNAAIYAVLVARRDGTTQRLLRELLIGSAALLVLGLPENMGKLLLPEFARGHAIMLAAATAFLTSALRSPRMAVGFAGAVAAGISVALLFPDTSAHLRIEAAAVFLLAHSLGWSRRDPAATFLRIVAGGFWAIDAGLWIHAAAWQIDVIISSVGFTVAVAWWSVGRLSGERRDWITLVSSVAVILALPGDWLWQSGSPGLMALAASLALFAVGFVIAWTRHLWERVNQTAQ